MDNKGRLFLIPNFISPDSGDIVLSASIRSVLPGVKYFLAEDVRSARRYLSSLKIFEFIDALSFEVLDKDTSAASLPVLCAPLLNGNDVGVISESGCPGVADPGAMAVQFAHQHGIKVVPLVGPSSILLALMASGLNGQKFAFHGYLPIDNNEASKTIRDLEKESRSRVQTQIFIETPYRNNNILRHLLNSLHNDTKLCVALDLTGSDEKITMKPVSQWKMQAVELPKKPAIFLFLA